MQFHTILVVGNTTVVTSLFLFYRVTSRAIIIIIDFKLHKVVPQNELNNMLMLKL